MAESIWIVGKRGPSSLARGRLRADDVADWLQGALPEPWAQAALFGVRVRPEDPTDPRLCTLARRLAARVTPYRPTRLADLVQAAGRVELAAALRRRPPPLAVADPLGFGPLFACCRAMETL